MTITARRLFLAAELERNPAVLNRMEELFFSSIKLPNGIYKTTRSNRLDDLNHAIINYLRQNGLSPTRYMDVAVSSGKTTYEWFQALTKAGFSPEITATDMALTAYLVQLCRGVWVLLDGNGVPLQYDIFGMGLRPWGRRLDYLTGYLVVPILLRLFWKLFGFSHIGSEWAGDNSTAAQKELVAEPIKLISRQVDKMSGIEFINDDITKDNPRNLVGRFHVIRAANVLNHLYFSDDQLRRSLAILRERLIGPGSLLLVCRTEMTGENHATLFRIGTSGGFEVALRHGNGSEIEPLAVHPERI